MPLPTTRVNLMQRLRDSRGQLTSTLRRRSGLTHRKVREALRKAERIGWVWRDGLENGVTRWRLTKAGRAALKNGTAYHAWGREER